MGFELLLKGGTVIDPAQGMREERDVAFHRGRVAAVEPHLPSDRAAEVVDCTGRMISPGWIDPCLSA